MKKLKEYAPIIAGLVVMAGILFTATVTWAKDTVHIVSATPMYTTEKIFEEVEVCTKGDDKTTEGAIVGGLLGAQEGKAGIGAILGAIIGDQIGEEKCHTEKRVVGTRQIYSHTVYVIELNGVQYTINQ